MQTSLDHLPKRKVHIVGAGLVGSLLAIYLARRGLEVEVHERRPDMRKEVISAGRSINLALSTRGIHALNHVGLEKQILEHAIPMRGRMIHALDGALTFQPYGIDDTQYINSISRGELNKLLMTHAERSGNVKIHFNKKVTGLSQFEQNSLVIGADGSASAIRSEILESTAGAKSSQSQLDYGYKELTIPAGPNASFLIEKNALHIWPRGSFMLIALPNHDGSFTCTLFLPFKGDVSFEMLTTPAQVRGFFEKYFKDALQLITNLEETFFENPTGTMVTIKCSPWFKDDRALLIGDAAHAIVPFFGQGMNCGFEDCSVLDSLLDRKDLSSWSSLFAEFDRARKTNADAIADLAVENFIEMRDKVGDQRFLLEKAVEKKLQEAFPGKFVSRYGLVTFSRVPYRFASDVGVINNEILGELCKNIDSADQLDLAKAKMLIETKLAPLLRTQKC